MTIYFTIEEQSLLLFSERHTQQLIDLLFLCKQIDNRLYNRRVIVIYSRNYNTYCIQNQATTCYPQQLCACRI